MALLLPSKTITLEEHAIFPSLDSNSKFYDAISSVLPKAGQKLRDHTAGRIADMDSAHVTYQVLSHTPGIGTSNVKGCRGANNEMAAAVKANRTRFGGFAVLPMAYPEEAAAELERAVKELGLFGALIDNHLEDGTHYDDQKFWPIFSMAEKLDVPIYIHPSPPTPAAVEACSGNFPQALAIGLATGAWDWHQNVGLHFLKLYASGLFDCFPKLKIILGHDGEVVPFMLDRADRLALFKTGGRVKKSLKQVWDDNAWVTTSGMFSVGPLATVLKTTNVERIMYSIDYPFEEIGLGWKFIEELAGSGMVTEEELDMIAYRNAEKLLKIKV